MPTSTSIEVDGVQLPIRMWGEATSPPLVLLHGLFGNSHEWDTVARRLATRRRVIVPDQRGHGAAAWGSDYTAARLVTDLAAIVDGLGLETFDLAGHSMGGIVAMLYAGAHPDRTRSLTVIDIGPDTLTDDDLRAAFLHMLADFETATYDNPEEVVAQWRAGDPLARPAETSTWASRALRRQADGRWAWRVDLRGITQFLTEPPSTATLWAAVDAIVAPTLILHGELSPALPAADARELADRLHDGTDVAIAEVGHDLGVQAPHAVARHIADFLDRIVSGASTGRSTLTG